MMIRIVMSFEHGRSLTRDIVSLETDDPDAITNAVISMIRESPLWLGAGDNIAITKIAD